MISNLVVTHCISYNVNKTTSYRACPLKNDNTRAILLKVSLTISVSSRLVLSLNSEKSRVVRNVFESTLVHAVQSGLSLRTGRLADRQRNCPSYLARQCSHFLHYLSLTKKKLVHWAYIHRQLQVLCSNKYRLLKSFEIFIYLSIPQYKCTIQSSIINVRFHDASLKIREEES